VFIEVFEDAPYIIAKLSKLVDCLIFVSNITPFLDFERRQSRYHTSQEPEFEIQLAYQSFTHSAPKIILAD
jgi:hypothetical protein